MNRKEFLKEMITLLVETLPLCRDDDHRKGIINICVIDMNRVIDHEIEGLLKVERIDDK